MSVAALCRGDRMKAVWRAMWDGLRLRCPSCRRGPIYRSRSQMHARCPHCGVVFERDEGEFVGGIMLGYSITGVLIVAGVFLAELVADLSVETHLVIWAAFGIAVPLVFYRNMKGIWLGLIHAMVGLSRD